MKKILIVSLIMFFNFSCASAQESKERGNMNKLSELPKEDCNHIKLYMIEQFMNLQLMKNTDSIKKYLATQKNSHPVMTPEVIDYSNVQFKFNAAQLVYDYSSCKSQFADVDDLIEEFVGQSIDSANDEAYEKAMKRK